MAIQLRLSMTYMFIFARTRQILPILLLVVDAPQVKLIADIILSAALVHGFIICVLALGLVVFAISLGVRT
jgi:hypothetical protein